MNDVLRQIVLTRGNKDLVAGYGVGTVVIFYSGGRQRPHIRAGFGLGQQHRAGPLTAVHFL